MTAVDALRGAVMIIRACFRWGPSIVIVGYPVVPWIAVMALGFVTGQVFLADAPVRQRFLIAAGTVATLAFAVIRGLNLYGDPAPWSPQRSAVYTALSFLDTTKYPRRRCCFC